jgi:hypothetical protein
VLPRVLRAFPPGPPVPKKVALRTGRLLHPRGGASRRRSGRVGRLLRLTPRRRRRRRRSVGVLAEGHGLAVPPAGG